MKNNFSPLPAFFCPLFTSLAAGEGQVAFAVTPGTWYPTPEWLCRHRQGGQRGSCCATGTSRASRPSPCSTQQEQIPPNYCAHRPKASSLGCLVPVRGSCSPQSRYHLRRGLAIKNYLSIRGRGRGPGAGSRARH